MDLNLNNWQLILGMWSCTALACYLYVYVFSQHALGDEANQRSLHQGKTLTAGGVFVLLPWLCYATYQSPELSPLYGVWLMLLVGLADDVWHWSAKPKLLAQLLVTLLLLYQFNVFSSVIWTVFLLLAIVWWLNLFNFMDGANGIAGLHAAVVLLFYAVVLSGQNDHLTLMAGELLGSILLFLVFNLALGRLFLGDAGSLPLAFVQAWLAVFVLTEGILSLPLVALLHAGFIADASYTLLVRIKNRARLSEAHNTHFYQRWVKSGAGHATVAFSYAAVTALCAISCYVLIGKGLTIQWSVALAVYVLLAVFFIKTLQLSR
ncbi:hypothetical protein [Marinicella rhabdoformis]|uniref:hypothetical protein n=1 Tax=Marinicella rhabdoformis TaxID=2580566 RepID=UPI0012AECBAB|nr:hypothetical protein [Marinicella rhabdoformis]